MKGGSIGYGSLLYARMSASMDKYLRMSGAQLG